MFQCVGVRLRVKRRYAVCGDIHGIVAVARIRDRMHDADVGADTANDDTFRLEIREYFAELGLEEGAVATLWQVNTGVTCSSGMILRLLSAAKPMHGNSGTPDYRVVRSQMNTKLRRRLFLLDQAPDIGNNLSRSISTVQVMPVFHEADNHIRYEHHIRHWTASQ